MPTNRIAALDGGTYYHHFTLTDPEIACYIDKTLYLRELRAGSLDDVETLLIPSRTNPDLLAAHSDLWLEFLERGGRLVVMGETEPQTWLPNIDFTPVPTNFWWWLDPEATLGLTLEKEDHPLFGFMTLDDATWHYHGYFGVPSGAQTLLGSPEGGAVLYEDTRQYPGTLLLTSLDPCYHHGSFFMPNATRFLTKFMRYLSKAPW
ncbi:MAG: hypothetical protein ACX931_04230 [Saccharospirillum sp.]